MVKEQMGKKLKYQETNPNKIEVSNNMNEDKELSNGRPQTGTN